MVQTEEEFYGIHENNAQKSIDFAPLKWNENV